jgi:uncharacterized RDD family membrane protein YckC
MKCPKCGYLAFEASERCRNCGYEFSLSASSSDDDASFDLPLDRPLHEPLIPSPDSPANATPKRIDLDRIIGDTPADLPLFAPRRGDADDRDVMIPVPSRPRAPLAVRKPTPEIPRARITTRSAENTLFETAPAAGLGHTTQPAPAGDEPAPASTRIAAALVDASLLFGLDSLVVYFTLRLLGLEASEMASLPIVPLAGFLMMLNGGYFVAFTAVGGQSIGKMALGIKVIGQQDDSVPIGRAVLRTLAYLVSALPLGAGFLPGMMGDRLALHDRLAHTRVVRPS